MDNYIDYLQGDLIYGNKYYLKSDDENLKNYEKYISNKTDNYKKNYKYHLDVLPQPFFGNITNKPKVLFLAKNPSYDDKGFCGYTDIQDTKDFKNDCVNNRTCLKKYIDGLSKVDFFKPIPDGTDYYVKSAWGWWQSKVIGKSEKILLDGSKVGFFNLCAYHSFRYNDIKANRFNSQNQLKNQLKEILTDVELIIIVWGKTVWDNFIKNSNDVELIKKYEEKNRVVLNKIKNKHKYGQNIISIDKIIDGYYDDDQCISDADKKSILKLKSLFTNNEQPQ